MIFLYVIINFCTIGCTEPFDIGTETFEDILVIEAVLTDELKQHEIQLSRTFRLEEESFFGESNADVRVIDNLQNEYVFEEADMGKYVSVSPFMIQSDRNYQLTIRTENGETYVSESVTLPQKTQIDDLYAEKTVNESGDEGIAVFVDSFDATGNAIFYRYEYEETYQIIAPFWSEFEVEILSRNPPSFSVVPRTTEERICYKTDLSNTINITNTVNLSENRITKFPVLFIDKNNTVLRNRYSILVRQFIQSRKAQTFYETLKEFSDPESLFSQVQPGFINGNISSISNDQEKVLGFFDVSSVSSRRIFFEFKDFFPNETRPPFFIDCEVLDFSPSTPQGASNLLNFISIGYDNLSGYDSFTDTYFMTLTGCGDCNEFGSNVTPDFWEN